MTEVLLQMAEEKFLEGDTREALETATLAKTLDPFFWNVDKYVASYGIHFRASERLSNGEQNHYAVLGFTNRHNVPDGDCIDNFFCKLVKKVHPDVHRSAAALGALKAITEAWQVLSDPSARRDYDLRCSFPSPPLVDTSRAIKPRCCKDSSVQTSTTAFSVS